MRTIFSRRSKTSKASPKAPPANVYPANSPYLQTFATNLSTSLLRAIPAITRTRQSIDRLGNNGSYRWDRSSTRLPVWEAICDEILAPNQAPELALNFEPEAKATPMVEEVRSGRTSPSTSSKKRVLKNIPTMKTSFWNMIRGVPRIKFVKKFEETEYNAGVGAH